MQFYADALGGELEIQTFGDYKMVPEGMSAEGIMHAQIRVNGQIVLMGSDGMGASNEHKGYNVSISGAPADTNKLREIFAKLAEGGMITMPLSRQTRGDEFGMLTDQFGVGWMVDIYKD